VSQKIFGQYRGCGPPYKIFLSSSLTSPCWLLCTVCAQVPQKNFGDVETSPFGWGGAWLTLRNLSAPMRNWLLYRSKLWGRWASPLDEAWLIPHHAEFCHYVKRYDRVYTQRAKSAGKMSSLRSAFQGHSRTLELTRIDRLPMTSCYSDP